MIGEQPDKVLTVERQILKSVPQILEAVHEVEREVEHRVRLPADQSHTKISWRWRLVN